MDEIFEVVIRPAKKEDAELLAKVVTLAIGTEQAEELYPIFLELARCEVSQYSYKNALVAEVEETVVGGVIGYDGADLSVLKEPLYPLIEKYLGRSLVIEEETSSGEFYIDSLAVLPLYKGRGIGKKLLCSIVNRAFEQGHQRVGLLVDFSNPKAEALYNSIGFKRVEQTTFLGHNMWHLQKERD